MTERAKPPDDPIAFIRTCVRDGKILWTYHVNMRLSARSINRDAILACADTYEVIECYPDDKYLPSYLVLGRLAGDARFTSSSPPMWRATTYGSSRRIDPIPQSGMPI